MAINFLTPREQPEGEVWFIAIKPEALGINYYISHLIGQLNKCSCHFSIATKLASNSISSTKISGAGENSNEHAVQKLAPISTLQHQKTTSEGFENSL